MTFLCALGPVRPPQVPRSHGVGDFTSLSSAPRFQDLSWNLIHAWILLPPVTIWTRCGIKNLKNNHPIGVPFMSSYAVNIHCEDWGNVFTNLTRRYVISLGWKTEKFSSPILPLTILVDYTIHMIYSILVHSILLDTKEQVVGCLEADLKVVFCAFYAGGFAVSNTVS